MPDPIWYLIGVLAFVVGLAVSIGLHEIGHLVPAKRSGVRVTQYMIGFGPTVWSRRRGETEYGVKAIPLGGYIRMIGMFPPASGTQPGVPSHVAEADAAAAGRTGSSGMFSGLIEGARAQSLEEFRPGDERRAFYALPVWRKLAIMLGGPVMNLVLAVVLIAIVLVGFGIPQPTNQVQTVSECVLPADAPLDTPCTADDPVAPAAAAGVQPGDVILAVDGTETATWDETRDLIRQAGDRSVEVTVERGGAPTTLVATPLMMDVPALDDDGVPIVEDDEVVTVRAGFLGVAPTQETVTQPVTAVPGVVGDSLVRVAGILVRFPQYLAGVADAAFGGGERDPEGPASIVGVGRLAGEIASAELPDEVGLDERAATFLGLLASLNIALFVFNLLPLLPLDGGHVAGALWEGVRKTWARLRSRPDPGPVDVAKALPFAYGVAVVLLAVSALLIYADIVRPIRLTG